MMKSQNDIDKSSQIAFAVIGVIALSMMKNMGIILYISISDTYGKFRSWIHKRIGHSDRKRQAIQQQKRKEKANRVEAQKDIKQLGAIFRGNLPPSRIWQPGQPSLIDTMVKVERPNTESSPSLASDSGLNNKDSLKDLLQELKSRPNIKRSRVKKPVRKLGTIPEEDNE